MSLDLYQRETAERVGTMPLVQEAEPGAFDNFWRGAGLFTMRALARTGRSIDMLGSVGPIIQDAFTGGSVAQDQYFKEHDDVFGSAVDYWTPRPGEVGVAGQIAGELATMLPMVIASPGLAIGSYQIGTGEDLVRKGVDATKAQAAGAVMGVGLGLGIWVPILGQNLWQRVLVGGAGFNVAQGVAMRGGASAILQGTPGAEDFHAFSWEEITTDVLLGLAFGGWAHVNPEMRAQGKAAWQRIHDFARAMPPSQVAALATLRQAQHLNVDSTPGKPATPQDVEAHVQRAKRAIEQVVRGQPVDVEDLPAGTYKADPARMREMKARADELVAEAERVRIAEDLPRPPEPDMASARAEGNLEAMDPADQARTIGSTIRQQLEITGMPTDEAQANATLWESFFRTAGQRYGVAPAELMKQYGVKVQALRGDAKLMGALDQATRGRGRVDLFVKMDGTPVTGNGGLDAHGNLMQDMGLDNSPEVAAQQGWIYVDSSRERPLLISGPEVGQTKEQVLAAAKKYATSLGQPVDVAYGAERATVDPEGGASTFYQSGDKRPGGQRFYSELQRQVEAMTMKAAPAAQWKGMLFKAPGKGKKALRGPDNRPTGEVQEYDIPASSPLRGVTPDEVEASGILEWLDLQQGKVTKEQVLAFLKGNGVRVTEVKRGGVGGDKTLQDPAIAIDTRIATEAGFTPEVNPEDGSMVAFHDEETGDIITADEIRQYARDAEGTEPEVAERLKRAYAAAWRIEQYWAGQAAPVSQRTLEDGLHSAGWGWQVVDDELQIYDRHQARTAARFEAISVTDGSAGADPRVPENVLEMAERLEQVVLGGMAPGAAKPTKFGQYQLPGGKNYTELLLTLPQPPKDKLPKGWRVEEMKKGAEPSALDALTNEYQAWLRENSLPNESADELLATLKGERAATQDQFRIDMMNDQMRYLQDFIGRWDGAQQADSRKARYTLVGPDGTGRILSAANAQDAFDESMVFLDRAGELDKGTFRESHWEEPNVLAHVRFNERTDADGKKVLFIEEIQSDWAQKGKKKGFETPPTPRPTKLPEGAKVVRAGTPEKNRDAGFAAYVAEDESDAKVYRQELIDRGVKPEDILIAPDPRPSGWRSPDDAGEPIDQHNVYLATYAVTDPSGRADYLEPGGSSSDAYTEAGAQRSALRGLEMAWEREQKKGTIPAAPFVTKTESWVGLVLKRMIREAAERGFDRIAWTTGEQQTARYTNALRKAVDEIEWTKTEKGVQIVGYKGKFRPEGPIGIRQEVDAILLREDQFGFDTLGEARQAIIEHHDWEVRWDAATTIPAAEVTLINNWRRLVLAHGPGGRHNDTRTKVVDTTEKEDVLSDAIGKAMADRILNDPNPSGVISGEQIVVADTGMASFYDRIVPNVAKDILKKLGGGQVGMVDIPTKDAADTKFSTDPDMEYRVERAPGGFIVHAYDDGQSAMYWSGRDWNERIDNAHLFPTEAEARVVITDGQSGPRGTTKQMAFELTPEVKQRALQGLPLFQAGAKGQIKFNDGETIIGLLEKADRSTFLHETGHFFLQVTRDLAGRRDTPEEAKKDWAAIQDWLGIKGKGEIPVEAHEKFARGFEGYLMTGQAPTAGLRAAFERFRDWLISIYESISALEVELSPEILGVFDRMLALRQNPAQPGVPRPAIEDTPAARKTVEEYKAKLEAGEPIEPVLVDRTNPQRVVDGNHRLQAHIEAGVPPDIVAVPANEAITKMGTENWSPLRVAEELGRPLEAEAPAARPGGTEPPPPRGSRGVEAAGAKALEERVEQLGIENEQIRSLLQHMADKETGWAQIGGRLDTGRLARDTGQRADPTRAGMGLKLGTPAFTTWIPKAEWWAGRPDKKMNEGKVKAAVKKALAGEPLKKAEQRTVDYMLQIANQRFAVEKEIGPSEVDAIVADMALGRELEPTTQNLVDVDLVAQAREIDEAALERAAIQYENDDAGFMAQVRRILEQASENRRAAVDRQEGGAEAPGDGGRVPGEEEGGARAGEPAGEGEGPDAVTREAERFVEEQPDRLITVGTDPTGEPLVMTAREYLETARAEASQARDDAALFEVAAQCLLGGGGT